MTLAVPENALPAPQSRNVSNSELTTFLACRQQYDFAFVQNLEPIATSRPLTRGTIGHGYFQTYIEARLNSSSHELSMKAGDIYLTDMLKAGTSVEYVLEVKMLVERYMAHHNGWPEFELHSTEQRMDLALTDTLSLPIRYDWAVTERATGRLLVGDFKFTYDFWREMDHHLTGQLPKYISVMQANGMQVHGGFLEEIRTRELGAAKRSDKRNLWRRTHYYPTPQRRRNFIRQHVKGALQIEEYRNLSDAEREAVTVPVLDKHGACKFCNFKELCHYQFEGSDLTHAIQTRYQQNTYGYNHDDALPETDLKELL